LPAGDFTCPSSAALTLAPGLAQSGLSALRAAISAAPSPPGSFAAFTAASNAAAPLPLVRQRDPSPDE